MKEKDLKNVLQEHTIDEDEVILRKGQVRGLALVLLRQDCVDANLDDTNLNGDNLTCAILDDTILDGADLSGHINRWRIKPANKIINMSHFIKSGIDCEFSSKGVPYFVAKLKSIHPTGYYSSDSKVAQDYWKCQPRMNHIHYWGGGECPLPEGFEVMPVYRDPTLSVIPLHASEEIWVSGNLPYDIIGYTILRKADGWEYPWESEEC